MSIKNKTNVSVRDAITTLKCLRELLLGSVYLHQHYKDRNERTAMQVVMANSISEYIFVLDLFLTDKTEARSLQKEAANAMKVLLGGEWTVLLSDHESILVLRIPLHGDEQAIKVSFPEHPQNATAYHRWKEIDIEASKPTEFGPPDENGVEQRP